MYALQVGHQDNRFDPEQKDAMRKLREGQKVPHIMDDGRGHVKFRAGRDQSNTSQRLDSLSDHRRFQEHFAEQQRQFLSQQRAVIVNTALD